ncbi:hypothetical protein [Actinokineospora cianjurensis]|uniref:hypothetical protein n=1 Tax=Actinokineospora cianjurensis TaxID=585224 RepID=UPI000EAE0FCB|nr:hypothetical protein [Actinokineospora cianjurensis]
MDRPGADPHQGVTTPPAVQRLTPADKPSGPSTVVAKRSPPPTPPTPRAAPPPPPPRPAPVQRRAAPRKRSRTDPTADQDLDDLARGLLDPLTRLLRAELRHGRERAGHRNDHRR